MAGSRVTVYYSQHSLPMHYSEPALDLQKGTMRFFFVRRALHAAQGRLCLEAEIVEYLAHIAPWEPHHK